MVCTNCGAPIPTDSFQCVECGKRSALQTPIPVFRVGFRGQIAPKSAFLGLFGGFYPPDESIIDAPVAAMFSGALALLPTSCARRLIRSILWRACRA